MKEIALAAGLVIAGASLHAAAAEGDDWSETCTQQAVNINYYQGTAYCTASSNGVNYPLSFFVQKTIESSVILQGGGGLSCRAQVPYFTTETTYKNVCTKSPVEPYPRGLRHVSWGCISQQAAGVIEWDKYDQTYEVYEVSSNGQSSSLLGTYTLDSPFPQYSIKPPGGTFTYKIMSRFNNSIAWGSAKYITFTVPNCKGRQDY